MQLLLLLLLFLMGCASQPETKKKHLIGECVFRNSDEFFFKPPPSQPQSPDKYPWEKKLCGKYPKITKDFFRCKGNPGNPPIEEIKDGDKKTVYRDCGGSERHGLPMKGGKEFIYPCLIELLNYVQEKTEKRVVITCGHRCPEHNSYCDHTKNGFGSKHMMGAEVDFFVEGIEREPHKIIALIQEYYKGQKGYEKFERYEKESNVSTKPWFNKEIFIKLFLEHEGRDSDNKHAHPYICLQVRYDRMLDKKVSYDAKESRNYLRS